MTTTTEKPLDKSWLAYSAGWVDAWMGNYYPAKWPDHRAAYESGWRKRKHEEREARRD